LYYVANIPFRILVKIIQGYRAEIPGLGILPGAGAGAQIKNQKEPELSLKFRTGAGAMVICEVAPGSGSLPRY